MQWIVCLPFHSSEFSQTYFSESIHQHTWALLESVRQTIWIPFRISCKWRASNECRAYFSAISLTEKPQDECQADPHCPFRRHTFSRNLVVLSCESGSKRLRWLECSTKNHDHVTWEEPFVHCSFFFFICFFQVLHDFIIFIFSDCLGAFFFQVFVLFSDEKSVGASWHVSFFPLAGASLLGSQQKHLRLAFRAAPERSGG